MAMTIDGIQVVKKALSDAKIGKDVDAAKAAAVLSKDEELCDSLGVPRIRPMDVESARDPGGKPEKS